MHSNLLDIILKELGVMVQEEEEATLQTAELALQQECRLSAECHQLTQDIQTTLSLKQQKQEYSKLYMYIHAYCGILGKCYWKLRVLAHPPTKKHTVWNF